MAIHVVCRGCKKRFQVDDAHAGKTGPCPHCKQPIKIPRPEDAVVIHEPENFGPGDESGRPVLKPIPRTDTQLSQLQWILIAIGLLVILAATITLKYKLNDPAGHPWILAVACFLIAYPVSIAGYSFLRDGELQSYQGKPLLLRTTVCAAAYTLIWGLYAWTPAYFYIDDMEAIHVAFFLGPLCCIAAIAPLAVFDLDYLFALIHCGFFIITTSILANIIGISLY